MKSRLGDNSEEPADSLVAGSQLDEIDGLLSAPMTLSCEPMAISCEQLAAGIAALGLVPDADLKQLATESQGSAAEMRARLLGGGWLTEFQLTALSGGREDSLRLGNYDLLDRLGAGAMGTVYKARHRRMKRVVAVKVLSAGISKDKDFVRRFQREVETVARLGHPNIIMAYDADEAAIGYFLVMEYVSGRDLAASVERDGPFPLAKGVDCILQVARGLSYAHSQQIIHRDIKPQNLLLGDHGEVKVIDLGLARLTHGSQGAAPAVDATMAGAIMGTPSFMPPEQAIDSSTVDHRADIYSLGCTLYFLLAGQPPYTAQTILSIMLKHRDEQIPRLSAVRTDSPRELDDLIVRMLAKTPEARVQQMADVVSELEAIARDLIRGTPVRDEAAPQPKSASDPTVSMMGASEQTIDFEPTAAPPTVLIVEPSRSQASIFKMYLEERSLAVAGTVASASEAIEAVRRLRPQAVVSAMHLADATGIQLAQQIQAEFAEGSPGFVLVTSESDEVTALGKLRRFSVLPKPFTAVQLGESVRQTIRSAAQGRRAAVDRSKVRVLVVDDSSTARLHFRTVLTGLGFSQIVEVEDGAHAIAVGVSQSFDLVVTDYNMPLMDGRALVSYFRQNPATSSLPILMATTETEPRKLDDVRQLGVVAILDKAFAPSVVGPLLDDLF